MYSNLKYAMKEQKITEKMIAKLLDCRIATVCDKINGKTISGFSVDEAIKIQSYFFSDREFRNLFSRDQLL